MSLQALIFDVDGTLAETEEIHRAAFNAAFKAASLDWHWNRELYARLLKTTGGKERIARFIAMTEPAWPSSNAEAIISALHSSKTAIYTEMLANGALGLRPGVFDLIKAASSEGVRLAIATTTSRPNVDMLLRVTLGSPGHDCFEVIAAGDSVPRKKPAPDIYLLALSELRLPAHACLAIEDSENGLRAASAASIPTLVVTSTYTRDENFDTAIAVVSELTDLACPIPDRDRHATSSARDMLNAVRMVHAKWWEHRDNLGRRKRN
ncbi:MAG: HAD-IA family hydrolase [Parvibaculaceae bacterium]